jgi:curli biogenesis system outer membrane secretion channel CsgG
MKLTTALTVLLSAVLAIGFSVDADAKKKKERISDKEVREALEQVECNDGPRLRVSVHAFLATGKLAAFEGYNVGEGLAAQLATELQKTGCFVVLNRVGFSHVLREQELGLAGIVRAEQAPAAGQGIGPQFVIQGNLTEYEANKRGRGLTVGTTLTDSLGLRLGRRGNTSHIGMDLQIVDAETGHIAATHHVQADSKSGGWTLGLDWNDASIGGDTFGKSPLGIASRNALGQAVVAIAEDLRQREWRTKIIDAVGEAVYVKAGAGSGVQIGQTYRVSTVVRELKDPDTGLLIDRIEEEVGFIEIVSIDEKYAIARPTGSFKVRRGDFVHL